MPSLRARQFGALLKKNVLLQARSRKTILGIGGWGALLLQVLVPALCFVVLYPAKHYLKPVRHRVTTSLPVDIEMVKWAGTDVYEGPAMQQVNSSRAHLVLAPDTPAVHALAQVLARALACPLDPAKRSCPPGLPPSSFHCMFIEPNAPSQCADPDSCMADTACWGHLLIPADRTWFTRPESKFSQDNDRPTHTSSLASISVAADEAAALRMALDRPARIDAVLVFPEAIQPNSDAAARQGRVQLKQAGAASPGAAASTGDVGGPQLSQQLLSYSLRMNHTDVPPTRYLLDNLDIYPSPDNDLSSFQRYWFFANVEHMINRCVLGMRSEEVKQAAPAGNSTGSAITTASTIAQPNGGLNTGTYDAARPASLLLAIKPFPWPAVHEDLGAATAAVFVNLLVVFAFLPLARAVIGSVVREKELRLREGMKLMGLSDTAYWGSWFLTHWAVLLPSGLLCAIAGLYPFAHTAVSLQIVFFALFTASLVCFSYFMSTLFSTSRVAGPAAQLLYAIAMIPGFVAPSVDPYAGPLWYLACLLPPSAVSLWTTCLTNWELISQGLNWRTVSLPVSVGSSFSASFVLAMMAVSIVLFVTLAWYLDKVLPTSPSQPLHPLFFLDFCKRRTKEGRLPSPSPPSGLSPKRQAVQRHQGSFAALDIAQVDTGALRSPGADAKLSKDGIVVNGVVKVFHGRSKVTALDGASLQACPRNITALLGHNGAGKTTLISVLTGLESADSGTAHVNGLDVASRMEDIRHDLGVCPQFDVLWPELSVTEHLGLHASLKGFQGAALKQVVQQSVESVGLAGQEDCLAGDLSGGQRRKLSLAGALVGSPSVVIVDEPTSGMDPYTRRFTWDLLRGQRASTGSAILLTTHSMEEAEALADYVVIMAHGRVVAEGTPQELKTQFGEGYTLTLVTPADEGHGTDQPPGAGSAVTSTSAVHVHDDQLLKLVQQHVPGSVPEGRQGEQLAFRLPRSGTASFPALLRHLDGLVTASKLSNSPAAASSLAASEQQPRVTAYGISVTTLEEVFLKVTEGAGSLTFPSGAAQSHSINNGVHMAAANHPEAPAHEHYTKVKGWRLLQQQLHGLLVKRAICALRGRWTLLAQILVPLALVALAFWTSSLALNNPDAVPLACDRSKVLMGQPTIMAAYVEVRQEDNGTSWAHWLSSYAEVGAYTESNATQVWRSGTSNGTLNGHLLSSWYGGHPAYDALFVESLPSPQEWMLAPQDALLHATVMLNQSAIHAITASLSQVSGAALRYMERAVQLSAGNQHATAAPVPAFRITNFPFPTLEREAVPALHQDASDILVVIFMTLATSLMAAMPAVHLVRERASQAQHVQYVSGARPVLFWMANFLWDVLQFCFTSTGIILLTVLCEVPQFADNRLPAMSGLLLMLGPAALSLTFLFQRLFTDEMLALQRLNTSFFVFGYLTFVATWLIDVVLIFTTVPFLDNTNSFVKATATVLSPHYCFARGVYDISQIGRPILRYTTTLFGDDPFAWKPWGKPMMAMACQAVVYLSLTMLLDSGARLTVQNAAKSCIRKLMHARMSKAQRRRAERDQDLKLAILSQASSHSTPTSGRVATAKDTAVLVHQTALNHDVKEDKDVAAERLAVQSGAKQATSQVLIDGVTKRYHSGPLAALLGAHDAHAVHAVKGLWVGIPRGECFGLLGVNGAGKTTTFNMLTGELQPDSGDAYVCGYSVTSHLTAARHRLGYCPQFESLLTAMTSREVLIFYARLRGVPSHVISSTVESLLNMLGLSAAANQACGTLSGGNKRKLALGVALIGDPPVALLDEPTTGVDPGARRAMWSLLKSEVMCDGRSVVLTSHSMEECEALCDRVAIMVAGTAACLGSCQHLKARFGGGYILHMQLSSSDLINDLIASLQGPAPGAVLSEAHGNSIEVHIPRDAADLAELFEWLEAHKLPSESAASVMKQVVSYGLSQATLESVFMRMAHQTAAEP